MKKYLTKELELEIINRKKKDRVGTSAKSLNKALRTQLAEVKKVYFETLIENEAFFRDKQRSILIFNFIIIEENYCTWGIDR